MKRIVFTILGAALAVSMSVRVGMAGDPPPFPDFTFKRVGVPAPGQGRIDVQIDPEEQARRLAVARPAPVDAPAEVAAGGATAALSGFEWFWDEVAASREGAGPANVARALAALEAGDAAAPRLQHLRDIAAAHGVDILTATIGTDVSPALVLALIAVESSGRTAALSGAGAQGLMQLIPDTATRFGVEDATDPGQNIAGGVAYLAWLLEHFDRDPILALAGYNAGENAVAQHGGVPPFAETRAYVPKVLAAWRVARGLCLTPPELITDGCVFAG
ncbi:lytic transglycosylase domain-containing protein [Maritimibacter fusiformis]|uniref:Lytic transglycosylase domain-containing protein n=1 Tax=Maritimibacter fusiformis TaxID=2603819 RepID=A0A5D0RMT8_9RHOB|nr:lytic transglycosylase domain-containing protein [Maritimibacter fusiformis]